MPTKPPFASAHTRSRLDRDRRGETAHVPARLSATALAAGPRSFSWARALSTDMVLRSQLERQGYRACCKLSRDLTDFLGLGPLPFSTALPCVIAVEFRTTAKHKFPTSIWFGFRVPWPHGHPPNRRRLREQSVQVGSPRILREVLGQTLAGLHPHKTFRRNQIQGQRAENPTFVHYAMPSARVSGGWRPLLLPPEVLTQVLADAEADLAARQLFRTEHAHPAFTQ